MATLLSRIIQQQCRQSLASHMMTARHASGFVMTPATSSTVNKEFWDKNKALNRPLSPHLSIYKPQVTSTLSILHRITGVGASVVLYSAGIGALFCTNLSFPDLINLIQSNVPTILISGTKAAIGGSLIYHTLNGVRHLIWDVGYGFQLKHLYLSGYIVIALTAIGTAVIFTKS